MKAVIGCMGDVDAYQLPDAKGYSAMLRYLLEEDDEYRQKVRDQRLGLLRKILLNTTVGLCALSPGYLPVMLCSSNHIATSRLTLAEESAGTGTFRV